MLIGMILTSVALAATAQITLKHGVNKIADRSGTLRFTAESFLHIATTPMIWAGLLLFGASAVAWLLVLSRASLSFAYPFGAITYLVILTYDRLVLHQKIAQMRWAGVILIVGGIFLISRTPHV